MKAIWNGVVIAESDDAVAVEGNHYFPPTALKSEHFRPSEKRSVCPWKGGASYYHVVVDGKVNENAARHYPQTKQAADSIKGRVAFWHGVNMVP
jgi:uncharacterized protein (DUF427 family)